MIETLSKKEYKLPVTEIKPLTAEAFEYLTTVRKLHPDTLTAYRVGCSDRGEIAIPFYDESDKRLLVKFRHPKGELLRRRRKNDDGSFTEYEAKTAIEPKGKPVLLGSHLCDPKEGPLVICFGDYDAMTIAQDGIPNAVGLPFGDKGFGFIDHQWSFLESFDEIILFPDNDKYPDSEAEQKALKSLDNLAVRLGKHKVKLVNREMYEDAKDANEILIKYGPGKCKEIVNYSDWFPSGIVAVADYEDIESQEGTPTGLVDVDRATGGFGGGQLIIISGDNGAGKTTEVLNIAANFIKEDKPVFIWSGEQKVGKIRYWFERIAAGPNNLKKIVGNKTGFEYFFPCDDVIDAVRNWYRHYFFQLTDVNIEPESFFQSAELAIRRYGCRLVIIDNLMAFTGGEGEGYYQAQGDFAQNCKRFAEKWDVPVILICHNKKPPETIKARIPTKDDIEGSKKITNWADVVIQMYRVPDVFKTEFEQADTILRLCKTRESGIVEDIRLSFAGESARFCQMSDQIGNDRLMGWEKESF
jgi:replicative DNA helicase